MHTGFQAIAREIFLYRREGEYRLALTAFVRQGLERNEKVICITHPNYPRDAVIQDLCGGGLLPMPHVEKGQLSFFPAHNALPSRGSLLSEAMIAFFTQETGKALEEGYGGLRIMGEPEWAVQKPSSSPRLTQYLSRLRDFLTKNPCVTVTSYSRPNLLEHLNSTPSQDGDRSEPEDTVPETPAHSHAKKNGLLSFPHQAWNGLMPEKHLHMPTEKKASPHGKSKEENRSAFPHPNHWEALAHYLQELASIAFLITDPDRNILHCNRGALNLLALEEIPSGRHIEEFLMEENHPAVAFLAPHVYRETRLNFTTDSSMIHSLSAFIFNTGSHLVFFCEKPMPVGGEIIEKLSALNMEVTSMARELQRKNRELEKANATITQLMNTDPLTGIANRRFFMENLTRALSLSARHGTSLSVVMADLDHFKKINDTWGHNTGDEVLKAFGEILQKASRREDLPARLGGEEFMVILPHTSSREAAAFAERVRQKLEESTFGIHDLRVTGSFGVAELLPQETPENLLKRADQALYSAKEGGRNRVVEEAPPQPISTGG